MRKILYWLFLFCIIWISQSFATWTGSWTSSDGSQVIIAWDNVTLKTSTWFTLFSQNLPAWKVAVSKSIMVWKCLNYNTPVWYNCLIYVDSDNKLYQHLLYQWVHQFYTDNYLYTQIRKNTITDWLTTYTTYQYTRTSPSLWSYWVRKSDWSIRNTAGGTVLETIAYNWQVLYGDEILNSLECTTETIPDTDIINIQPTSTWSIAEYIENPTDKEYWYSTSLSGENPLLVSLLNANDVLWWDDFSYQTGSVSFKTLFTQNTFFALSSSANIEYFKMLWGFGNVDIYTYKEDAKTIRNIYENVNLNDWGEGFGFPVWWTPLVVLQFKYSLFTKEIDSLEVYSIWANNTKEVEICYNEDDDQYFVDWEEYTWNPYTDLVWEPEPTEVSFTSSWYLFFENWFCLSDFLPFPSGGDLLFDIKTPLGNILTTYPIKNTWLYKYWIGTCSKITTNYHEQAWQYYVKWRYIYKWVSYDIQPNFFAYTITKPESIPSDINPWLDDWPTACWVSDEDAWFLPWVSRFFACISETISSFFKNQYEAVKKIWSLIYEISDIFTTEVENPFSFLIPQASASEPLSWVMTVFDRPENFAETPFWKIEKLMWGAFAIVSLIVVLSLIIMIKGD